MDKRTHQGSTTIQRIFDKLGASFVKNKSETMFEIYPGENKTQMMIFTHPEFEQFFQSSVADTSTYAEVLILMEVSQIQRRSG